MIADLDTSHQLAINNTLFSKFSKEINEGFIQLLIPPSSIYEKFNDSCSLKRTFNDTLARVIWRSKLVLDVAYLMDYCKTLGDYYLHIEDDTPYSLKVHFLTTFLCFLPISQKIILLDQLAI